MHLNRIEFPNNNLFFYHIYNALGCTDLTIAYAEGDKWTKWYSYEWLMSQNQDTRIIPCLSKGFVTVKDFYELANNRTILDIEIVIDLDTQEQLKKYDNIMGIIRKSKVWYASYKTGGKGIHIHILKKELREMSHDERVDYKEGILNILDGEVIKANSRVMIALESSLHRKTGKKKELIEWMK